MWSGSTRYAGILAAFVLAVTPTLGCTKAAKKARHIARGDKYVSEKKYKEAVIEYRNVLQIDPNSKEVNRKLGMAAYEAGNMAAAYTFLGRAYEQDPNDIEVRLRLGALQLFSRQPQKAREHAKFVLAKDPNNFVAVGLLADSASTTDEIDETIALLEDKPERFGQVGQVERALGLLYARKRDVPRAEKALVAAVQAKPDSAEAHSTLGRLHLSKGELDAAEKEFRAAAGLAPPSSRYHLELADFLFTTGKSAAAKVVLEEITQKVPDAHPAWVRLADLACQEKRFDDCQKAADVVLKAQPDNTAALLLLARVSLARGETKHGFETASRVVKLDGKLPMAHYVLALAHLQAGNASLARNAANDAVARAPQFADAVFLAADLAMRAGDAQGAAQMLRSYTESVPNDPRPHLQLGTALLQGKDIPHATESFQAFIKMAPTDPRGPFMLGMAARVEGKPADARKRFEEALQLSPAFADALVQLTDMSFRDKRAPEAIERARKQANLAPKSGEIAFVLASAHLSAGQTAEAEKEFLRTVELNPGMAAAYGQLVAIYGRAKDWARATTMVNQALAKTPDNPAMLMLAGVISQSQGDNVKARDLYEKILAKQPKFGAAANNLAYILAEEGKDLSRAQTLAQVARDAQPQDPDVADTLGWVLYKQGAYPGALTLFKESVEKRQNPEVMIHLGLTQDKLGDKEAARATLRKALELNPNVAGAAEAKAILERK